MTNGQAGSTASVKVPSAPPVPTPVAPDRWLALIRMVVGFWFAKSLWTKLSIHWAGGLLPLPVATDRWAGFMPVRLAEWAETNPVAPYRAFLVDRVIPNAELFATLTALGEAAVGLGLLLGLLTGWAALGGLFLMANYMLGSLGMPLNQQGLHIVLVACLIAFLAARAGRIWGADAVLLRRFPGLERRLPLV